MQLDFNHPYELIRTKVETKQALMIPIWTVEGNSIDDNILV